MSKFSIQSLNQSNTSAPQPEDSEDAAVTAKQPQAQAQAQAQVQTQAHTQSSCEHQQYLVHRLLYGARLIDEDGNAVVRIGEWLARRFDLKHCDRVTAQITSQNPEHPRVIIDEVDHCHQAEDQNIEYFNLGLIEQVGSQLVVTKSADGSRTLADSNPAFSPYRISPYTAQKFSLHAGDIVDLAWYAGAPRTTRIVWKHSADEHQPSVRQTKKHSEYHSAVMTAIAQSGNTKKTAIAHTNSPLMIERAIYRANAGMPAYESAGAKVNYPVKRSRRN